jgi:hypothetical protein
VALPEVVPIRAKPFYPDLFGRLPGDLFKPLASANHERYWALLTRLHRNRFGPDAPLPPAEGLPVRDLVVDIERELSENDPWEEEDGTTPTTSINARAHVILGRLVESGWLEKGKYGAEKVITMSPVIGHFLDQLVSFAESGPVYIGAKIHSIEGLIDRVHDGDAGGDVLMEAAQQTRNLLQYVRNTSNLIREMMASLRKTNNPADFVNQFFDYIERVFLGDYRELRTREHPLAKRHAIMRTVEAVDESPDERNRLVGWYEENRFPGDRRRAEVQYERDLSRLRELSRMDEYLDRLDNEVRRANRQARVYLDYSIRTVRPIDQLVRNAIHALEVGKVTDLANPFPAGGLVSADGLAVPRTRTARPQASALRTVQPSPMEIARSRLAQRAMHARMLFGPKLTAYLLAQASNNEVGSNALDTSTVENGRAYQELAKIAFHLRAGDVKVKRDAASQVPGFVVTPQGNTEEDHPFISGVPFSVARRTQRSKA